LIPFEPKYPRVGGDETIPSIELVRRNLV